MRRLLGVELGELITARLVADSPAVAHLVRVSARARARVKVRVRVSVGVRASWLMRPPWLTTLSATSHPLGARAR